MTAGAGQLADWTDVLYTVTPPSVRLVAQATQSMAHNTVVPIQFAAGSEVLDNYGWHDETTNNTRVVPTLQGWYEVSGSVAFGGRTDYVTMQSFIRTAGANVQAPAGKPALPATQISSTTMVPAGGIVTVYCNGTTDYIELCAQHTNGASAAQVTQASGQFTSTLEVKLKYRL